MFSKLKIIFCCVIFAGANASECESLYAKYPLLQDEGWSFRIDDKTNKFGCGIIPIYDMLRQYNAIELMDAIDQNPQLITQVAKLFKYKKVLGLMATNPVVKNLLIENANNIQLLENINYLFDKYLNYAVKQEILKNPVYLNYFILASANAIEKQQANKIYRKLKKFSLKGLEVFSFVYGTIGDEYEFSYLLENFITLKKTLSKNQLQQIAQYPEYLAYFLYPSKEEMKLYGTDKKEIYYQQKRFQKLMISIYKNTYKYYQYKSDSDENVMALLTMKYIYPYVVVNRNYYELENLFTILIHEGFINELWERSLDVCNKKKIEEQFAIFGQDTLNNILRLQKNENNLYHQLLSWKSHSKSIFSLAYVANAYNNFPHKQWKIFKNLIYNLPNDSYSNILVLKMLENVGYFKNVVRNPNYSKYVQKNEDDASGKSTLKYKFILFTSYPSDNDPSAYELILDGKLTDANKTLNSLYAVSIEELETHNFTLFEKNMEMVDNIDTALTVAAIVAAPFTGGVSLSYVAVKQSGKIAAKKSIKYYAKKLALKSRKLLNKTIYKARKVRKALKKPLVGKNPNTSMGHIIDKAEDKFSTFTIGAMIGGMLFLAIPNDLEAKQICEEEDR